MKISPVIPARRQYMMGVLSAVIALASGLVQAQPSHQRLVDPTIPPPIADQTSGNAASPPSLQLQATKIGETSRLAVVNGTTLRVGSKYNGWVVSKIDSHAVILKSATGTRTILLHPSTSKTPPRRIGEKQVRRAP